MRTFRVAILSFVAFGLAFVLASPAYTQCQLPPPVHVTAIGHPIWAPVDFHVFTAPMGYPPNFQGFYDTENLLLHPVRHQNCPALFGPGPGEKHQPPYIHEMEAGLDIMNYREGYVFSVKDFKSPNGVFAAYMLVPNPGVPGSSPDFDRGPIIPNGLFPIHVEAFTYRNGKLWDPNLGTFDLPPMTVDLACSPGDVDGHSHIPMFTGENLNEVPGATNAKGDYEFREKLTDAKGNGWSFTVYFAVR